MKNKKWISVLCAAVVLCVCAGKDAGNPTSPTAKATKLKYINPRDIGEVQGRQVPGAPYWIGRNEVTIGEWLKIMGDADARNNPNSRANLPVSSITLAEAMEYCEKLTISEQKKGQLPKGKVYRLPTVREWNFVSHPHFDETGGRLPDKETNLLINRHAWIKNNSKGVVHPVGRKPPNRLGIHDMLGNVHEFCLSSSGELKRNDQSIYFFEGNAVFQGGSYNSTPRDCLSYYGILHRQGAISSALKQPKMQISQGTINLLAQVQGDIRIDFYFALNREEVPVDVKNQADRILSLLQQFGKNYKGGEFTITVIDPKPDTYEAEDAEKSGFGIKGRFGKTLFYTGIKIIYEEEETNINFLHESKTLLEHEVITTIYGLANDEKPIVGLINTMNRMEENQPFFQKIKQIYEIESISATATALPNKTFDVIIILHPKNLPDSLLYDIDQYLLGGGKLFIAVDPSSWIDQYTNGNVPNLPIGGFQVPKNIDANSDLDRLFKSWGVKYDKTRVLADLSAQMPMPKMGEYPAYIRIDGKTEIKPNDLTQNTNLLLFMEPGFFSLEDSELTLTPLVQATPNAGWLNASDLPRTQSLYPQHPFDQFQVSPRTMKIVRSRASSMNASIRKDGTERHLIAGILKGTFKTAFPDGKPSGAPKTASGDNKPDKALIKEGNANSEVVLFADFDFFNTIFQRYQTTDTMRPVSAHNNVLALNLLEYLATGKKHLAEINIGKDYNPVQAIEISRAKHKSKIGERNKEIDREILKVNQHLESELARINQKMQLQQREAQMKMLQESRKQQALLEPYRKFIRPDGKLALDKKKDAETIQKLMVIQQQMNKIRKQVQDETRKAITALQADINVIQEETNDKIAKLKRNKFTSGMTADKFKSRSVGFRVVLGEPLWRLNQSLTK